jgi:class 3 adenylate cyclase
VLLQTYLGHDAATAQLGGRVGLGKVEQIRVVVIYCDLFGFTSLTETLDARSLIDTSTFSSRRQRVYVESLALACAVRSQLGAEGGAGASYFNLDDQSTVC